MLKTTQVPIVPESHPEIDATAHYQAAYVNHRWSVVRGKDNHVFCICRSQIEAYDLAKTLNRDYVKDPKNHQID